MAPERIAQARETSHRMKRCVSHSNVFSHTPLSLPAVEGSAMPTWLGRAHASESTDSNFKLWHASQKPLYDLAAGMPLPSVIASEAKQSMQQQKEGMDCVVANAPRNGDKTKLRDLAAGFARGLACSFRPLV
jgi:hypothetical protein